MPVFAMPRFTMIGALGHGFAVGDFALYAGTFIYFQY